LVGKHTAHYKQCEQHCYRVFVSGKKVFQIYIFSLL